MGIQTKPQSPGMEAPSISKAAHRGASFEERREGEVIRGEACSEEGREEREGLWVERGLDVGGDEGVVGVEAWLTHFVEQLVGMAEMVGFESGTHGGGLGEDLGLGVGVDVLAAEEGGEVDGGNGGHG